MRLSRYALVPTVLAIVALAAVLIVALPGHSSGQRPAGSTSSSNALVGRRWTVTTVQDRAGTLSVPRRIHAFIGYTHDGYTQGDDGVNALQGHVIPTAHGYRVRHAAGTAVGGTGGDPSGQRVSAAVDAMFFSTRGATSVTVTAEIAGHTLTLGSASVTLTLRRAGTQPDFLSGASSTPTGTR